MQHYLMENKQYLIGRCFLRTYALCAFTKNRSLRVIMMVNASWIRHC